MKKILLFIITSIVFTIICLSVQNTYSIYVKTVNQNITLTTTKLEATFLPGPGFNVKIKKLAGNNSANSESIDTNITSIVRANILTMMPTEENIVSDPTSSFPIYAWFDNGVLYYYTEVEHPYLNEQANIMFYNLSNVTNIDISTLDTSKTTNMRSMFNADSNLVSLNLSNFDTSKVQTMQGMFYGMSKLTNIIGINNFDTSSLTDVIRMFANCTSLEVLNLESFDLSKVTDTTGMFKNLNNLKELKTPKVYPNDTSVTLSLPKTMYDSNLVSYTTLGRNTNPSSPVNTWIKEGYTVTLDSDGGTVSPSTKIYRYGDKYGVLSSPTKAGYTFLGWNGKNIAKPISSSNYNTHMNSQQYLNFQFLNENGKDYIRVTGPNTSTRVDTAWRITMKDNIELLPSQTYSLSFDVRSNNSIATTYFAQTKQTASGYTGIYNTNLSDVVSLSYQSLIATINDTVTFDNDGNWHRVNMTITTPSNIDLGKLVIGCDVPDLYGQGSYVDIANIQLELGNTSSEFEPYYITSNTDVTVLENHTLKAIWEPITYTVNYNSNGGTGSMSSQSFTYGESYNLSSNSFTKTGYTFNGWNILSNGEGKEDLISSFNDNFNANFEKLGDRSYKVDYTLSESMDAYISINFKQPITKGKKYNLVFNVQGLNQNSEVVFCFPRGQESRTVIKNGFNIISFTTWNGNDSISALTLDDVNTSQDHTAIIYLSDFKLYEVEEGKYYDQEKVSNLTSSASITLYAIWKPNTYTIKFNNNGGTGTMNDQTFTYDSSQQLTTNTFTKTGYKFRGWSTSSSDNIKNSLINYTTVGRNVTEVSTGVYSFDYSIESVDTYVRIFLKEILTANTNYVLLLNAHQDSQTANAVFGYPSQNLNAKKLVEGLNVFKLTIPADTATNTVFDDIGGREGAFTLSDFKIFKIDGTYYYDTEVLNNLTTTNGQVINLYAIWEPITYTVNFDSNGGTGTMSSQKLTYDAPANLNSNTFSMTDYTFGGWNGIFYSNNTEKNVNNDLYSGNREFLQYVDLAPYFNKYGTDRKYHLELDLRPEAITGSDDRIQVYFQNSVGSRYTFKTIDGVTATEKWINFTSTSFVHVSFDFEVKDSKMNETAAMLAFYGIYDSGRKPIVKNVRISLLPELEDGELVSNLTTSDEITLYARWKKLLYSNDAEVTKLPTNSNPEYVRYADLAPYIDEYGEDSVYHLELDLKSKDTTNNNVIRIYFQNGSNTKYSMPGKYFTVTTEYQHVSFDFVPVINDDVNQAYIAFFGTYNTGNIPVVKNVRLYVYKDHQ